MALIKPLDHTFAKIKVVGVGGGGSNAVNFMINSGQIHGVEFIVVNTDAQALSVSPAEKKVQIGGSYTKGLGAGANPEVGRMAAEEDREQIKENLYGADMVFIAAGMGGGTGTGASPIIAQVARELGALTVAIVTRPFGFEGSKKKAVAEEGIENLRDYVDALIIVPNQRLMDLADKRMTLIEAFSLADSVLAQSVKGISELITSAAQVNIDFNDVKTIMQGAGTALMGIGEGSGDENRAVAAARAAISSPLLELSIDGARGVLYNIIGGPDLTMDEVAAAGAVISNAADPDAEIIFGNDIRDDMAGKIKIIVIATGFDSPLGAFQQRFSSPFSSSAPSSFSALPPTPPVSYPSPSSPASATPATYPAPAAPNTIESIDDEYDASPLPVSPEPTPAPATPPPAPAAPKPPFFNPFARFSNNNSSPTNSVSEDKNLPDAEEFEDEFDVPAFLSNRKH